MFFRKLQKSASEMRLDAFEAMDRAAKLLAAARTSIQSDLDREESERGDLYEEIQESYRRSDVLRRERRAVTRELEAVDAAIGARFDEMISVEPLVSEGPQA